MTPASVAALDPFRTVLYVLDGWLLHFKSCAVVTEAIDLPIPNGIHHKPGPTCTCGLDAEKAAVRAVFRDSVLVRREELEALHKPYHTYVGNGHCEVRWRNRTTRLQRCAVGQMLARLSEKP